jgi:hypothetical protein
MLLGINGFAQSGKDTMADRLVEEHGFTKVSFAAPMKEMLRGILGFSDEQLYGDLKEVPDKRYEFTGRCLNCHQACIEAGPSDFRRDCGEPWSKCGDSRWNRDIAWYCTYCDRFYPEYVTPRLALQSLGTEWGRTLYAPIWAEYGIRFAQREYPGAHIVFADVRFHNEVGAIKQAGGYLVRLRRGEARFNHASEKEMMSITDDAFDMVLNNTGSLEAFIAMVDGAVPTFNDWWSAGQ